MDPITQGAIGASAAQLTSKQKSQLLVAAIVGWIGGMAADLDIVIRSSTDPLLAMELHRHFSHSLFFIPVGGLIVATFFKWTFFRKHSFRNLYFFATAGYATHALLDACTAYGTLLLWPFSNERIAFDTISIIDPIVTLPLCFGVLLSAWKKNKKWAIISSSIVAAYFAFGFIQNARVKKAIRQTATHEGHEIVRLRAMPSFGNLLVWRGLYEANGTFYVHPIRAGITSIKVFPGSSIPKLNISRDLPNVPKDSVQYKDIQRFSWFASDWIALHPDQNYVISDVRYSFNIDSVLPIWGIRLTPDNYNQHIRQFSQPRDTRRTIIPWKFIRE